MNLALGAVLLAILLIPPLIFYYAYTMGSYAKAAPKFSVLEYLLISAVISLGLHCSIIHIWKLHLDFEFLFRVLAGQMTEQFMASSKGKLARYFHQFSVYILVVCTVAAIAGWLLSLLTRSPWLRRHSIIRWLRSNRPPGSSLRYFNKWWYFFRIYEYSSAYEYLGNKEPVIFISLLIDTKDACVLYEGALMDWVADGETLDRIYIASPTKRLFSKKNGDNNVLLSEGDKIEITSDGLLSIPYAKVINMHIQFINSVVPVGDGTAAVDETAFIEAISEVSEEDIHAIETSQQ